MRSAPPSLPTIKGVEHITGENKHQNNYPFPIEVYQQLQLPNVIVLKVASYHGFNSEGSNHFLKLLSFSSVNH